MLGNVISFVTVAFFAVVVGMPAGLWIARRLDLDGWGWLVASAVVSAATMAPPYLLGQVVPLTLTAAAVIWGVTLALTWVFSVRSLRYLRELEWPLWETLVVLLVAALALVSTPWLSHDVDTFYHLAAIRSLIAHNTTLVVDPLYGTTIGGMDPSSGLFHTLFAVWCLIKGADPLFLLRFVMVVSSVLSVAGFAALMRALTGDRRLAALGGLLYTLLVLFADFRSMAYSSSYATAFVFAGLIGLISMIGERRWTGLVLLLASGTTVAAMHLGAAQLMLCLVVVVALGATIVQRTTPGHWKRALVACALVGVCMAPALALRVAAIADGSAIFHSQSTGADRPETPATIAIQKGAVREVPGGVVALPRSFSELGAPSLLLSGVLALALLGLAWWDRDPYRGAAAAIALTPILLAFVPPLTAVWVNSAYYVGLRLLLALKFAGLIAVVLGFASRGARRTPRVVQALAALTLAVMLFVAYPLVWTVYAPKPDVRTLRLGQANESVWRTKANSVLKPERSQALGWMRAVIGDEYPVVMAEPDDGYELAGLLPVAVVAVPDGHSPLAVESSQGPARREAAAAFFDAGTPLVEQHRLAEEWGATYVFLWVDNEDDDALARRFDAEHGFLEIMVRTPSARLYRVR